MSKAIQVLEQLGQDANLQTPENIESYLATTELDNELTEALVNKDVTSLERSLDVCPDIVCIIATPEDDEFEIKQNEIKAVSNG